MASIEVIDSAFTERAKKKVKVPESRGRKVSRDDAINKAAERIEPKKRRGVIYVGHIPHGFYENEMKRYFSQFGTVTRLKMSRSRKTGRSRGYAFIEFEYTEVANIAAEAMNNYLMFDKLLKCHVVKSERVHRLMFRQINRNSSVKLTQQTAQQEHNRPRSVAENQKRVSRLLSREQRKRRRLAELGLDYDFPGYLMVAGGEGGRRRATHTIFTEEEGKEKEEGKLEGEDEEVEMEEIAESE